MTLPPCDKVCGRAYRIASNFLQRGDSDDDDATDAGSSDSEKMALWFLTWVMAELAWVPIRRVDMVSHGMQGVANKKMRLLCY